MSTAKEAIEKNHKIAKELYSLLDKMVEEPNRDTRNELRYSIHDCLVNYPHLKDVGMQ